MSESDRDAMLAAQADWYRNFIGSVPMRTLHYQGTMDDHRGPDNGWLYGVGEKPYTPRSPDKETK